MFAQWFRSIQAALEARWGEKLPMLLTQSRNFATAGMARIRSTPAGNREAEIEKVIREAYTTAYRQAYVDCIVDVAECGLSQGKPKPEHPPVTVN